MSFTYNDTPADEVGDAIRFLIGDTDDDASSQHISDGEILFFLPRYGFTAATDSYTSSDHMKLLQMALEACRALVAKYAKEAPYSIGGMNETAESKAIEVRKRSKELERLVAKGARPRVFGRSHADKVAASQDTDLVQSIFQKGMFDNTVVDTR